MRVIEHCRIVVFVNVRLRVGVPVESVRLDVSHLPSSVLEARVRSRVDEPILLIGLDRVVDDDLAQREVTIRPDRVLGKVHLLDEIDGPLEVQLLQRWHLADRRLLWLFNNRSIPSRIIRENFERRLWRRLFLLLLCASPVDERNQKQKSDHLQGEDLHVRSRVWIYYIHHEYGLAGGSALRDRNDR